MKGIIVFFCRSFTKVKDLIEKYFEPCIQSIKVTGNFDNIEGPIMNVLRKAFQTTYRQIF